MAAEAIIMESKAKLMESEAKIKESEARITGVFVPTFVLKNCNQPVNLMKYYKMKQNSFEKNMFLFKACT